VNADHPPRSKWQIRLFRDHLVHGQSRFLPSAKLAAARLDESRKPAREFLNAVCLTILDGFARDQRDADAERNRALQNEIRRSLLVNAARGPPSCTFL
jgi:hypothetical protein